MIDMHLHSILSDGELKVEQLVEKLKCNNISHAILTDHDCVIGTRQFINECHNNGINSCTGVELQAYYDKEKSLYLHMLCYNFKDEKLMHEFLEDEREKRILGINNAIKYLKTLDVNVSMDDVKKMSKGRHLLINHLCVYLESIGVMDYDSAYSMFCDESSKCYIEYPKFTVEEIIEYIHSIGGLAVLAHPKRLHFDFEKLDDYVKHLKDFGLDGIETYYGFNTLEETKISELLADKYQLIATAGSDWHCESDGIQIGMPNIPEKRKQLILRGIFNE